MAVAEEGLYGDAFKNVKLPDFGEFFKQVAIAYGTQANPYGNPQVREAAKRNELRNRGPIAGRTSVTDDYMYNRGTGQPVNRNAGMPPVIGEDPNAGGAGGPGAPARNPINALFAPMFEDLRRQRQLANQRYEANRDQVTNIYGQITGARSADKAASATAFQRLIDAATTRSTAVNTGIDTSEAARLQQNQAALQGMGLQGLSTSQGDIASQTAAQAKQTNALNSANWAGMLSAMQGTAGQQVDADVAAFNYAMLEDQGRLRGAREEFAQELGQQRGELKSQRAKATFDYQQAQQRSAAAAKAAEQRIALKLATQQEKSAAAALKRSGPVIAGVQNALKDGMLQSMESGTKLTTLLTEFLTMGTPPAGETRFNPTSARSAFFTATEGQLNSAEQLVAQQILAQIKW
jgi:hypothetical protein